jgi:PadR family transcriptional regulator PadR
MYMKNQIMRKFLLGFIQIHILHNAKKQPFYGAWMLQELEKFGYEVSPGTLYPILHTLEEKGFIFKTERTVEGKIRKYYNITQPGIEEYNNVRYKASELFREVLD